MSQDVFFATVVGAGRIQNFDRLPDIAQAILIDKVESYAERMADLAGQLMDERLGSKSGRLTSEALRVDVSVEGKTIKASLSIPGIPYAQIQEEGGTTPAHMIYPVNGKVLAFIGATGDKVMATRVFHPGGTIQGKHFMRDARRQMGPEISRGLKKALVEGIRQNMRLGS